MKEKQIGSVKTFFIVAVLLSSILIGSVYFLNNRGETALVDKKDSSGQESKDTKKTELTKTDNKPTANEQKEVGTDKEEVVKSENLPTTGPESTFLEAALLFIVTFLIANFIQSRNLKLARQAER